MRGKSKRKGEGQIEKELNRAKGVEGEVCELNIHRCLCVCVCLCIYMSVIVKLSLELFSVSDLTSDQLLSFD